MMNQHDSRNVQRIALKSRVVAKAAREFAEPHKVEPQMDLSGLRAFWVGRAMARDVSGRRTVGSLPDSRCCDAFPLGAGWIVAELNGYLCVRMRLVGLPHENIRCGIWDSHVRHE